MTGRIGDDKLALLRRELYENERRKRACVAEMVDFEIVNGRKIRVSASEIVDFE